MKKLVLFLVLGGMLVPSATAQVNRDSLRSAIQEVVNDSLQVYDVLDVDREKQYTFLGEHARVSDPYGTLAGAVLFTAHTKHGDGFYRPGVFGVYRNEAVVWQSDPISGSTLLNDAYGAFDLQRDGTVELLATSVGGLTSPTMYLWIFEWDGQTGRQINREREEGAVRAGTSTIPSGAAQAFRFEDLEGDGVWEIIGGFSDRKWSEEKQDWVLSGEVQVHRWNGETYVYSSEDSYSFGYGPPDYSPDFPVMDAVEVRVDNRVQRADSGFVYAYTLSVDDNSPQDAQNFLIGWDANFGVSEEVETPEGWEIFAGGYIAEYNVVAWHPAPKEASDLERLILSGPMEKHYKQRAM